MFGKRYIGRIGVSLSITDKHLNLLTYDKAFSYTFNDYVKITSAVRQAHGPEQSRRAVLRFIPALLNDVRSSATSECEAGAVNWKAEMLHISI